MRVLKGPTPAPGGTTESRTAPTGLLQAGFGRQADERQKTASAFWIENGVALRVFVPVAGEGALLDGGFGLQSDGHAPRGDPLLEQIRFGGRHLVVGRGEPLRQPPTHE